MIELVQEAPWMAGAREALLDCVFGPARFEKSSERLREGRLPEIALAGIDEESGHLVATVRLWNVVTGDARPALLLGPLAVTPELQGQGVGAKLMRRALNQAAVAGHKAVFLVGDGAYYERFGFTTRLTGELDMPGPVERDRFLGLELIARALSGAHGCLTASGLPQAPVTSNLYNGNLNAAPWPPVR